MIIKKCPVCKSTDIDTSQYPLYGKYFCKKCNYSGPILIEEETKES